MNELTCVIDECQYELINNDNILFKNILENMNLVSHENLIFCCPTHKIYHICHKKYGNDCIVVDGKCYFSKNTIIPSGFIGSHQRRQVIKTQALPCKTPIIKQLLHKFSKHNFTSQLDAYLKKNNLEIEKTRFNCIAQNLHHYITYYVHSKCNKQHTNLERCIQKIDFIMQCIFYSFLDQKIPTTFTRNKIFKEVNILISRDLNCTEKDLSQRFNNTFKPEDLYITRRRQKSKIWK